MKIRMKLISSFLVVAGICALVGLVAFMTSTRFTKLAHEFVLYSEEKVKFDQLEKDHLAWISQLKDYAYGGVDTLNVQTDDHQCRMGKYLYNGGLDELRKINPEIASIIDSVKSPHFELHESAKHIDHARTNDLGYAAVETVLKENTNPSLTRIRDILSSANDKIVHKEGQLSEGQKKAHTTLVVVIWLTICIAVVIALGLGLWLARDLMNPIQRVVTLAEAIRQGDLSQRIKTHRNDELGHMARLLDEMADGLDQKVKATEKIAKGDLTTVVSVASEKDTLGKALSFMTENLSQIIGKISIAGEQVNAGSGEVSSASQSLSQGATQQAASLEEITSSITEIGSQTKTNAENAGQAKNIVSEMKRSAEMGNVKMQSMVEAMENIKGASREISKIIKVIDDIAFQTNLLALNAAVEAARAGVHGKGFAVVAEEVRGLAGRSAKAASETSELIAGSIKKTESGTAVANETFAALEEIFSGVTKTSDLINEIAAASTEQAQGVNQIVQGLRQIDDVTQKNTSSAEETASAAEELSSQATELRAMLTQFTLKANQYTFQPQQYKEPQQPLNPAPVAASRGWGNAKNPDVSGLASSAHAAKMMALDDQEFGRF